jgi:hypothetical protein
VTVPPKIAITSPRFNVIVASLPRITPAGCLRRIAVAVLDNGLENTGQVIDGRALRLVRSALVACGTKRLIATKAAMLVNEQIVLIESTNVVLYVCFVSLATPETLDRDRAGVLGHSSVT